MLVERKNDPVGDLSNLQKLEKTCLKNLPIHVSGAKAIAH